MDGAAAAAVHDTGTIIDVAEPGARAVPGDRTWRHRSDIQAHHMQGDQLRDGVGTATSAGSAGCSR